MKILHALVVSALLMGCSDSSTPAVGASSDVGDAGESELDAASDIAVQDLSGSVDATAEAAFVVQRTLPDTSNLGMRRQYRVARGIIHAHSVHSHDACDGDPEIDGEPNEPCLQDFRDAICDTRQDFVFMTDHEELAAEKDFETLLMIRGQDERVMGESIAVANRMMCSDGFRPLLLPGGEFGTMPVGLERHVEGDALARSSAYEEVTPERVQALKDLGAVVLQAHAESRDRNTLRELGLDGFEVYQLHANVDPNIRREWLGLNSTDWLADARPFIRSTAQPDLVFLTFFTPNRPALDHFDALVAEGQRLVGTGGTDCHQNSLPVDMGDGERMDSYRRMMRWFSNHLLVENVAPQDLKQALRDGRSYIAFEIFGTPDGFDFRAEAGQTVAEIGGDISLADSPTLHLEAPQVVDWGEVPVRLELLKIEADGARVVAQGTESLTYSPTESGAYRAIVYIQPTHLRPALGPDAEALADREFEWVWANPIYVSP